MKTPTYRNEPVKCPEMGTFGMIIAYNHPILLTLKFFGQELEYLKYDT